MDDITLAYAGLGLKRWTNIELIATVGDYVGPMSKMTVSQSHLSTFAANNTVNMPTFAQLMTAIWDNKHSRSINYK